MLQTDLDGGKTIEFRKPGELLKAEGSKTKTLADENGDRIMFTR